MDQLEILKKEWMSREQEFPKFTFKEIYPMLLKKSSSIVKWIVIISLAEIALWTLLSLLIPESNKQFQEEMGLKNTFIVINVINYVVVAIFIYLFYKNYQKIQVTNTVSTLMKNILRTRKTVHYFVYYNIGMAAAMLLGVNIYYYANKDRLYDLLMAEETFGALPPEAFLNTFFIAQLVVGIVFIGFLMLFYYIVYGLLLKRLKRNYRELQKIEV